MRICLLTNQDLDAVPFVDVEPPCDPRPYLPQATWQVAVLEKGKAVEQVTALARERFDLFFNLCDGAEDDQTTPGIEVVLALERLGVPFTGATSSFFEPSRQQMKQACRAAGIATPAYAFCQTPQDVDRAAATLRFPMFVKHASSYSSIGLSRASRVRTLAGLRRQARKFMARYARALIEEYVEGTEYTVLVVENPANPEQPTVYSPLQYRFPAGESFKHEKLKWVDWGEVQSFPVEDAVLAARLRHEAGRFFVALHGTGYGRCDVRVDNDGTPFWLEINPQCGVYYPQSDPGSADLILRAHPAGHEEFTRKVIDAAMARHAGPS